MVVKTFSFLLVIIFYKNSTKQNLMQIYFSFYASFLNFLTLFGQFLAEYKGNVNFFNSGEPFENFTCITFRLSNKKKSFFITIYCISY